MYLVGGKKSWRVITSSGNKVIKELGGETDRVEGSRGFFPRHLNPSTGCSQRVEDAEATFHSGTVAE